MAVNPTGADATAFLAADPDAPLLPLLPPVTRG